MYEIFNFKIDTIGIQDLADLKAKLMEKKIIHPRYGKKLDGMDERELKNFVYTGVYEEKQSAGVAPLFTFIRQGDLRQMICFIVTTRLTTESILRLMVYTLENDRTYRQRESPFYRQVQFFKKRYERGFKEELFELGQRWEIDRLDLIGMFLRLMRG